MTENNENEFIPFADRVGNNLNRRKLTIVSQTPNEMVVDVTRDDSDITSEGSKLTASKLNEVFNEIKSELNSQDKGTKVKINEVGQEELNFTSDPQTQIDEIRESIPTGLPIGAIITSAVPLTDASVHLLDGSTISQTGIYADFVTYLKSQISAGYDLSCTQTEFDNDVQSTGNCGKFVIDDTAGTIRLPKITRFIQGLSSINDIGKSISAGLPNIEGKLDGFDQGSGTSTYAEGALDYRFNTDWVSGTVRKNGSKIGISFNASKSNTIYGSSSTVQPQATQYPYYIVLTNSVKTDIVVDIDNVTTELNNISHELTNRVSKTDYNALGDFVDIFSGSNVSVGSNITLNESMLNFNFLLFRGRNENNGSAVSMVSTDWFYTICDNEINRLVACTDATYCSFIRVNDTTIKVRNFSGGINYITISGIGRKKQ